MSSPMQKKPGWANKNQKERKDEVNNYQDRGELQSTRSEGREKKTGLMIRTSIEKEILPMPS